MLLDLVSAVIQKREHLRTLAGLTLSAVLLQPEIRTAIKNSDITFLILFLYDISDNQNFKKGDKKLFTLSRPFVVD